MVVYQGRKGWLQKWENDYHFDYIKWLFLFSINELLAQLVYRVAGNISMFYIKSDRIIGITAHKYGLGWLVFESIGNTKIDTGLGGILWTGVG